MSDAVDRLQAVFSEILEEADANPAFAERLARAMEEPHRGRSASPRQAGRRRGRRPPGVLDPFAAHSAGGETELREALGRLDIEQLKDIVAEHGMDTSKLALKWKTPERLIDLIATTVDSRARKGQAFTIRPRGRDGGPEVDAAPDEQIDSETQAESPPPPP